MLINYKIKVTALLITIMTVMFVPACLQNTNIKGKKMDVQSAPENNLTIGNKYKVTFIELGSVRCIPCQEMQPVMKSIEAKYGKEVKVDFHDVWTEAGKPYGVKYGIEAIPTQIFLDETGKEFYRHVGYFPEQELVKVLQRKGVKPI
jgi:thioredoxin 1